MWWVMGVILGCSAIVLILTYALCRTMHNADERAERIYRAVMREQRRQGDD